MANDKIRDDHALVMYQPGIKGTTNHGNTKASPFPLVSGQEAFVYHSVYPEAKTEGF